MNCFSFSLTSIAKSLTANDEHFLDLIFFVLLKNFEMPIHSPNNPPFSIFQIGTWNYLAKATTNFLYVSSVQSSAKTTNLA